MPDDIQANIQKQMEFFAKREMMKNMTDEERKGYLKNKQKLKREQQKELDKVKKLLYALINMIKFV